MSKPRLCDQCKAHYIAAKVSVDGAVQYLCRSCTEQVQKANPEESLCQNCHTRPTTLTTPEALSLCPQCKDEVAEKKKESKKDRSERRRNKTACGSRFPVSGACAQQGRRPTMEDADVSVDHLGDVVRQLEDSTISPLAFYGVYDGHGGSRAANYLKKRLHKRIAQSREFGGGSGNMEKALVDAFVQTDAELLETSVEQSWCDGSTAVVALLVAANLWIANVGDSECVVARKKLDGEGHVAECVSIKHKPSDPSEKERIQKAGGVVLFDRLGASMAVSRSFGDRTHKFPYNKAPADHMSAVPYVRCVELKDLDFIILACDGLWDKFDYQDAVDFVSDLKRQGKTAHEAAELIVQESLNRDTLDNVSAICVFVA